MISTQKDNHSTLKDFLNNAFDICQALVQGESHFIHTAQGVVELTNNKQQALDSCGAEQVTMSFTAQGSHMTLKPHLRDAMKYAASGKVTELKLNGRSGYLSLVKPESDLNSAPS